jgi:methylase of polypeptide subunit release factors
MSNQISRYLKTNCSLEPYDVDRLFISAFIYCNKIHVNNNEFVKQYIIQTKDKDYNNLNGFIELLKREHTNFNFETLIELFEFVISPKDRVVTGAVYTPLDIRNFIMKEAFATIRQNLCNIKIADIACGCGGFLYNAAMKLKRATNKSYAEIFEQQIFGLDVQEYSITRAKLLLSVLALSAGEDSNFNFNLYIGDALDFNWKNKVSSFIGFDIIVGNPPYVCARNLDIEIRKKLDDFIVCKSGNPDLYIPFFQIGIENLSPDGVLGFITMNTFFKSLNGRNLRKYFSNNSISLKIIDFGAQQIFKSKNTYTCICLIQNIKQQYISFASIDRSKIIYPMKLKKLRYEILDNYKGWNLKDNDVVSKIESTGTPFGKIYTIRNGIATLKNDIYIFKPVKEDKRYYYLQSDNILFPIEKKVCLDIINSNKLSRKIGVSKLKEKIIFPYSKKGRPILLDEDFMEKVLPKAYKYLQKKKRVLDKRDKGKGKYENWYAYGRTQSLERYKYKLFLPGYSNKIPHYIINTDSEMLFYNGLAIIGSSKKELQIIKKILETKLFWYYIKNTSKPYSSNYYFLGGNYIKNFGICDLNNYEIKYILREKNQDKLNSFFERKYKVSIPI